MSRAGNRDPKFRPQTGLGRIGKNRLAWLRTAATGQLALLGLDPQQFDEEFQIRETQSEEGTTYLLVLTIPGRRTPLKWNLSGMTLPELEATRRFFNLAFDLADPVVRERDKVAADASQDGDDSYSRIYRGLPEFVIREGAR